MEQKCKDCDYFCRFPNNKTHGICAEMVADIVSNNNVKLQYITDEEHICHIVHLVPM